MAMSGFHEQYIQIRNKEGRLYTDETVGLLPEVPSTHPHYSEWMVRKRSSNRLIRYLTAKNRSLRILEIGCGNGWLCHRLSLIPHAVVTGQDINFTELEQAIRVFGKIPNLRFTDEDLRKVKDIKETDAIIFAASIQYFSSLEEILRWSLQQLTSNGEIHILDSPFYDPTELDKAKRRTLDYFTTMGFSEMSRFYYHNSHDDLHSFGPKLLYNPRSIQTRILHRKDPFPWYCIIK